MTNEEMRELSGSVVSFEKLTLFFYLLMRDHLTPGVIEKLVDDVEQCSVPVQFTNGWLAQYAMCLSNRLSKSIL